MNDKCPIHIKTFLNEKGECSKCKYEEHLLLEGRTEEYKEYNEL